VCRLAAAAAAPIPRMVADGDGFSAGMLLLRVGPHNSLGERNGGLVRCGLRLPDRRIGYAHDLRFGIFFLLELCLLLSVWEMLSL
jgi:hypothetical protein